MSNKVVFAVKRDCQGLARHPQNRKTQNGLTVDLIYSDNFIKSANLPCSNALNVIKSGACFYNALPALKSESENIIRRSFHWGFRYLR